MSGKPVALRQRARRDIDETIEHYLREAGPEVAHSFIDALEEARRLVAEYPATGSSRYARELNLPGLRFVATGRFPYLVFYVERETCIEAWRVLHGARDIAAWMRESAGPPS